MNGAVVVKVSGVCVEEAGACESLWRVLGSHGPDGLVLVHGGGRAITAALERAGFVSDWVGGVRITAPEHMETIAKVLCGQINVSLTAALVRGGRGRSGWRC